MAWDTHSRSPIRVGVRVTIRVNLGVRRGGGTSYDFTLHIL